MNLKKLQRKLIDTPPRQLYYELRGRLLNSHKPTWNEFSPIFVLSTGRAGTETLNEILQNAPNLFSYHEPIPNLYRLSKLSYESEEDIVAKKILREAFLTARQDLLEYSLQCDRGYAETSPQATFLAPIIFSLFPNVRFIHLVRDPYAVIRSGMRRQWYNGHPNDSTRISLSELEKWESYSLFQKNVWLWAETNRWILNFLANIPSPQKILLRSEEMFAGNSDSIKSIFDFIQAPLPSSKIIKKILLKKLNAQENGEFLEPSEWGDELKWQLSQIAGKTMSQLGYLLK